MKPAGRSRGGGGGGGKASGPASCPPSAGEKVVHSRSQALFGSGTQALGDALSLLVPRSTAFRSSEAELWAFLCSLKHEFSPVILRSKDVYGYASCRAVVPDLPRGGTARRAARRGAGAGAAPPAASKAKRPRRDAKSRPAGGAKKRREDPDAASPQPWAGQGRPDPPRTPREASPPRLPPPRSDGGAPQESPRAAAAAAAAFPPIRVRGNVWKRRDLEATRRRAQRLLRVNLAPVVQLRRIPILPGC